MSSFSGYIYFQVLTSVSCFVAPSFLPFLNQTKQNREQEKMQKTGKERTMNSRKKVYNNAGRQEKVFRGTIKYGRQFPKAARNAEIHQQQTNVARGQRELSSNMKTVFL